MGPRAREAPAAVTALEVAVRLVQRMRWAHLERTGDEPRSVWVAPALWRELEDDSATVYVYRSAGDPRPRSLCGIPVELADDPRAEPRFDPARDLVLRADLVSTPRSAPRIDG